MLFVLVIFFFFKQKTAYEMRISDWSSDVCSSDLWNRQEAVCCGSVFVRTGATQRPLNRQFAALAAAQGYAFPSTNPYDRLTDLDANLNAGNEIGGIALRVKWDNAPGTPTPITAWRYWGLQPEKEPPFTRLPAITQSQHPPPQN